MIAILFTLLLPILFTFWNFVWKRRGLPPGPPPLPLFGNTLTVAGAEDPYKAYQKWAKEYGPVYTYWLGELPVVTISDYKLMHELFVRDGDAYAGREFLNCLTGTLTFKRGHLGVIQSQGEVWKVMRRFGLQAMRNMGVGKSGMEKQFLSDITMMMGRVREEVQNGGGGDLNLHRHTDRLVGSTINRLLFGFAFADNQLDYFYTLKDTLDLNSRWLSTFCGELLVAAPWLRHLPHFCSKWSEFDGYNNMLNKYIDEQYNARVRKRKEEMDGGGGVEEPKDLLDHYLERKELAEREKAEGNVQEELQYFDNESFQHLCFDLFLAGQETTATTLSFLILYLMRDQRTQAKLHAELDQLDSEAIGLSEKPRLHYTNAVINEVQRLCNLLPLNLLHKTMRDVEVNGYRLKEGTVIVPQISTVLFDEKIFPNPDQFLPERFLDENGHLQKCDQLAPFGMGKRVCMGESLARTELFLFTANFSAISRFFRLILKSSHSLKREGLHHQIYTLQLPCPNSTGKCNGRHKLPIV